MWLDNVEMEEPQQTGIHSFDVEMEEPQQSGIHSFAVY